MIIDPGEALARELVQMVRRGSASEVHEFARGDLVLLSGYVQEGAPLAGMTLEQLREEVGSWNWLVAALVRDGKTLVARGDTDIRAADRVMVMASRGRADEALGLMGLEPHRPRKVVVMGASRLASMTAGDLVKAGIPTILVDSDADRCRRIAAEHERLVVVHGDPTDPKVLRDEGADGIDAVLAQLSPTERSILIEHYGLTEDSRAKTLEQLGNVLGISKERVRQIEIQALKKLRNILNPEEVDLVL